MTTMSLHDVPQRHTGEPARRSSCSALVKPTSTARLRRPDRSVLSEAIAAFFIGRNKDGFWVARAADRPTGGLFLLKSSALAFAQHNCEPYGCALVFEPNCVELDVENRGNRFVHHLGRLKRIIKHLAQIGAPFYK